MTFPQCDLEPDISELTAFGRLEGRSAVMRRVFGLLAVAARSDVSMLLQGETGTGKDAAAAAIHAASDRRGGPFLIIDCGAIPAPLLESELFGHEKGAFTGAAAARVGAFEAARGGTVLLDEIGELPLELQPKLLRVLDQKQFRRLGTNEFEPADVRVIAATNRDLARHVVAGQFRADLYFRLSVLKVELPPLRERPGDVDLLARRLLVVAGSCPERHPALFSDEFFQSLARAPWPGNVRELRNYLECCVVFGKRLPLPAAWPSPEPAASIAVDIDAPYAVARARCIADFERVFAGAALRRCGGNIARAAMQTGIDRAHLWRIVKRARLD
ncbi:MAG TPA: sigma-54 dependent transcriptional regulator [Kofleriaceae bacterium]|nr:sigma-54 dependent transcriptional regulator [Kofleriaceae bacterium]